MWRWLAVALVCLGAVSCSDALAVEPPSFAPKAPREPPEPVEPPPRPTLVYVGGDVMSSAQIRDAAVEHDDPIEGIASMLRPLAEVWPERDALVLVNLETPIASRRRNEADATPAPANGLAPVHLQGPGYLAGGLAHAGVDAVTLANNHALDQEPAGLSETWSACRQAGLLTLGAGRFPQHRQPVIVGDPGASVALLSFYDAPRRARPDENEPSLSLLDESAYEWVAQTRREHFVVAIVHVLGELVSEPEEEWRVWAQGLADAGADAIIVHGTHVALPIERLWARGGPVPIAWGLGNLLTDMGRQASPRRRATSKITSPEVREGLIARIEVVRLGDEATLSLKLLPVFETDDRFVRWHGRLPPGESDFWVRPTLACERGVNLQDDWPEPYRDEYRRWVKERRDHTVAATGLTLATGEAPCPGRAPLAWLDAGTFEITPPSRRVASEEAPEPAPEREIL